MVCALGTALAGPLRADPSSRKLDLDFFRDIPSRNLNGLAVRSDGRIVAGPTLTELTGVVPANLLWCLTPSGETGKWLVGTGPEGKILEITVDPENGSFSSRDYARLDESHVFALARLADGSVLAGTSPHGMLCLVRDGRVAAKVVLPADSVLDVLLLDDNTALVSTGNPGRIYRIDLKKFASAGLNEKFPDDSALAARGVTLFGEIRDRNIRRIVRLSDGRIAAGSAPRGNIYTFPATGGAPLLLQENRDGEVTDLLPMSDGGFFATITFSDSGDRKGAKEGDRSTNNDDRFNGRGAIMKFPVNGFPETVVSRTGVAFYRLARQGEVLLVAGGDQGELVGFDLRALRSVTYAGSVASQLNGLIPVPGERGQYLLLRNNAAGFALLDFSGASARSAETRRLDLGSPSLVGELRFDRPGNTPKENLSIEIRASNGTDEVEGWTQWVPLTESAGGWHVAGLRGRYVKLRFKLKAGAAEGLQFDHGQLYSLPQNRRPVLQDFRILAANYSLIPAPDIPASANTTLGQLVQTDRDDKRKAGILSSQVVPSPGGQIVYWSVTDPDNDNLAYTFSIRRNDTDPWIDLALNTRDPYVQFDVSHLPDGIYYTRLVATEIEPRAEAERNSVTFETDDLTIDHTPPKIVQANVTREADKLVITVEGKDALSLLDGIEATFNNGAHEQLQSPADGIRDSREETFILRVPATETASATSVEITLYDEAGNSSSLRIPLAGKR